MAPLAISSSTTTSTSSSIVALLAKRLTSSLKENEYLRVIRLLTGIEMTLLPVELLGNVPITIDLDFVQIKMLFRRRLSLWCKNCMGLLKYKVLYV